MKRLDSNFPMPLKMPLLGWLTSISFIIMQLAALNKTRRPLVKKTLSIEYRAADNFKQSKSVMYSKDQYSSLLYNPPRRPQTPLASSNYNPIASNNKSYTKMGPSHSPHAPHSPHGSHFYNPQGRQQPMSKSRVSVNSSASQLSFLNADQGQIFPEDLIFLLRNEQKNINGFKEKIEKEKARVENDFAVLKMEIDHILEDLKLSVQAELDQVYKVFISKYAEVKGEVQEIRRLRKEILMANYSGSYNGSFGKDSSNNDILNEIEKDAEHFRNFKVYGYLSEMQKTKINPILEVCNDLILIGSVDCPFYKSKEMGVKAKELKSTFAGTLAEVYQKLDDYVMSPEMIIQKQRQEEENANNILSQLDQQNQQQQQQQSQQPLRNVFEPQFPQNKYSPPRGYPESDAMRKRPATPQPNAWDNQTPKTGLKRVGQTEQCSTIKWADNLSLKKIERVITDHQDSILCVFFVDDQYIATGSKDKTINIYSLDGKKVTCLRGHDAPICSLSTVRSGNSTFLASGSDHGCCCMILWDVRTWTISSRIQSHSAAVTSIVDLQDGQHLLTGSYDKKINLYSHRRGEIMSSYNNKSGVTCMVLTSDRQRVVSSGLENTMVVWAVVPKANGVGLEQIQMINNNAMICTMEASLLRPELILVATRDGKLKMYNLDAQTPLEKAYTANENMIIELVAIEREMAPSAPLVLSCSAKDSSLRLTRMDSGQNEAVKASGGLNVQFGCGIGPKIVVSGGKGSGTMAILSQSSTAREFSLYEMQFK